MQNAQRDTMNFAINYLQLTHEGLELESLTFVSVNDDH